MIIIGTTLYNSDCINKTIESIKLQNHNNWKCYITNDLSTNDCVQIAKDAIGDDKRFVIINNEKKMWQTGNYWQICNHKDVHIDDIFVEVDGDDWLSDENVLVRVEGYYSNPDVWLTYGSFVYWNNGQYKPGFARPPQGGIENQRKTHAFTTSHLRTWRVKLFRHLTMADVCEDNGVDFIPVSGDLYFFQCMLEMCGEKHSKFIEDVNYVYNENDLSEHKVDISKVFHYTDKAKTRPVKEELEQL